MRMFGIEIEDVGSLASLLPGQHQEAEEDRPMSGVGIPGYTFGTEAMAKSPVTPEELAKLEQAVGLTDEDHGDGPLLMTVHLTA